MRVISIFYFLFKIFIYKDKKKFDYWYISSPDTISAFFLILLAKFNKKKILYEVRDIWPASLKIFNIIKFGFIFNIINNLEYFNHKNADFILYTPSNYQKRLNELNINTRSFNIFGFYEHFYVRENKNQNKNLLKLVYVGYLNASSVPYFVLEALKIMHNQKNIKLEFNIIGYGPLNSELKNKYKKFQSINFIDIREDKLAEIILKKSDIGIVNYNNESIIKYGISPRKLFLYLKFNLFLLFNEKPNLANPYLKNCVSKNPIQLIKYLNDFKKNYKSHEFNRIKYSEYFKKKFLAENLFSQVRKEICQ